MAEVQARSSASRGRGSGRAGRGGYSSRGGRSAARPTEGELPVALPMVSLDEQGEIGQLKKQYATELATLKELFADWTDDDLVLALEDTDGDLPRTIERISEGNVSQFSDVKKKTKEKSKAKKEAPATSETITTSARGRGRGGSESARGGRGRTSDRGGRGRGGRGGSVANGVRSTSAAISTPTTETTGWGAPPATSAAVGAGDGTTAIDSLDLPTQETIDDSWESKPSADSWANGTAATLPTTEVLKSSIIPAGTSKSWASIMSQPKISPAVPGSVQAQAVHHEPITETSAEEAASIGADAEKMSTPLLADRVPDELSGAPPPAPIGSNDGSDDVTIDLAPPKDLLTEDNLEHLPDESKPVSSETVASTVDASSVVGSGTPLPSSQHASTSSRPPLGGFATSAWKATGTPGRSASFQKRIMEQREAVVMPTNHAVDRAAVQFGSMGLNGDSNPLDVDDEREETQTRAPVAQSPPSQPRTSLPPSSHQHSAAQEPLVYDSTPTPKPAPGLPMSSQAPSTSIAGPVSSQMQSATQNVNQAGQSYGQYGRYGAGPGGLGQEPSASASKPYDAFNQQLNYGQNQESSMYPNNSQSAASGHQTQTHGGYSQGPNDFSSQYGTDQPRNSYHNYYGGAYNQQIPASQQEHGLAPQRSGSAFTGADSSFSANPASSMPSRFNENQNSGHTTPIPTAMASQQGGAQSQQVHHAQSQPQGQTSQGGGYPYGNPYYGGNSYYGNSYMNQQYSNYYNNHQQQGYGAPYGGKGNMYGQTNHGYGMSPQTSYEQSASPANAGAFANNMRSGENSMGGGAGEYGRSSSTQPNQQSTTGGSGSYQGHGAESYGRANTGYSGQSQGYGQQQQIDETLKPFGGEGAKGGPSPASSQPGRTSSAANNTGYGGSQSGYQQQSQQGFGGYPNHLNQLHNNHGSGYGGIGGLGGSHQGSGQQSHQTGGYGGGYGGFGNNNYNYGRGGWGGNNYGGH